MVWKCPFKYDSCGLHCSYFVLTHSGNSPSGNTCEYPQGIIRFSKDYSKLSNRVFTTIRRYDTYVLNAYYTCITPSRKFTAKLYLKEKIELNKLSDSFLKADTDCSTRQEAIKLLNSFYRKSLGENEKLTILYFSR